MASARYCTIVLLSESSRYGRSVGMEEQPAIVQIKQEILTKIVERIESVRLLSGVTIPDGIGATPVAYADPRLSVNQSRMMHDSRVDGIRTQLNR